MRQAFLIISILSISGCSTALNTCYLEAIVNPVIIATQKHINQNAVVEPPRNCSYVER